METPLVAVYGSSAGASEDLARARELGAALARAGFGVLNGGYGGTMEAAAAGARAEGGVAVGVTCAAFTFRTGANEWCSEVVEAADLFERVAELVRRASAYVVLPGGNGTMAELALAWEHQRKGLLPARPLVVWEEPWRRVIAALEATPYLDGGSDGIVWVDSVEAAVDAVRRDSTNKVVKG
jgi:hypothetical protein